MKVIEGTEVVPPGLEGAFITIGNFDGVHLGHRHIFQKLIVEAARAGRSSLLVTFVPHPKMVLHPERRPFYLLTTVEEKLALLEALGLDAVILIPFTASYAETTAESFILDFLWQKLRIGKIFIGHDYKFGRNKGGNEEVLSAFGKKLGFEVSVVNAVSVGDTIISSTKIRQAILGGDVKKAASLLGRPYNVTGAVTEGKSRGAGMGFPTANVKPNKELLPARGVYAAIVVLEGTRYQAVLNLGVNPTFGDASLSLEVHIMDSGIGNIYGKLLDVLFIDRIRGERRFERLEDLIAEIKKDVARAKEILKSNHQ